MKSVPIHRAILLAIVFLFFPAVRFLQWYEKYKKKSKIHKIDNKNNKWGKTQ